MTDIPPEQSLIEYPSRFPIKVMGANVDGFVHAITLVAKNFDPDFDAAGVETGMKAVNTTTSKCGLLRNNSGSKSRPLVPSSFKSRKAMSN